MTRVVLLDTGPLGLITQRRGRSAEADACKRWVASLSGAGVSIYVPEIADYELRRELLRAGKVHGLARLDALKATAAYLPLTTQVMMLAADLWATARKAGLPTADAHALDADAILAAQSIVLQSALGLPATEVVVATHNVSHMRRFVAADAWRDIAAPGAADGPQAREEQAPEGGALDDGR